MRRAVIFGAGAVGRGFLGEIFSDAGWLVSFVDVDSALVKALADAGNYRHRTVGATSVEKLVGPVEATTAADLERVSAWLAEAGCVVTAVGASALPGVMRVLAAGLEHRYRSGGDPVDVLLCENLPDLAEKAAALIRDATTPAVADLVLERTGLVTTSIGRMIPATAAESGQTAVAVEPYRFLPIDVAALKGPPLGVPELVGDPKVGFAFYANRKLFVHNLGHFLCGLLGQQQGSSTIADAIRDPWIRYFTRAAMIESAAALATLHQQPLPGLLAHVDDLLFRFGNQALADPVSRVIRDPARKMAGDDRVLGAWSTARSLGMAAPHLGLAVAAGTLALARERQIDPGRMLTELLPDLPVGGTDLVPALLGSLASGWNPTALSVLIDQEQAASTNW